MTDSEALAYLKPRFQTTPWKHDPRSDKFSNEVLFGVTTAVPSTMARPRGPVLNQFQTLRCTGYGTAANGWYIHGTLMNPDWAAAKIGQKQGRSVDGYGGDPNATMKHQRDDGFLPQAVNNYTLENNHTQQDTAWKSWDALLNDNARIYDNVTGYTKITNRQSDYFDAVVCALWRNYDPNTKRGAGVDAFMPWYGNWSSPIVSHGSNLVGYHRALFIDFERTYKDSYLILQNSYGSDWGDKGFQYFPRDVINWTFAQHGTSLKTLATLTPEQLAEAKKETTLGRLYRVYIDLMWSFSEAFGRR